MTMRAQLVGLGAMVVVPLTCAAVVVHAAPTTASNKLAAERDVRVLARLAVLPPGAERLASEPEGDAGLLGGGSGFEQGTPIVISQHTFWRVSASFRSVVEFIKAHQRSGKRRVGIGEVLGGPGYPRNRELEFSFPAIPKRISTRTLVFEVVALRDGTTGIRVETQDMWVVARSPNEKVPAGVREIDITSASSGRAPINVSVSDPSKVKRIVRWFDALGVVQPGAYSCPAFPGFATFSLVKFYFRAAPHGTVLAQASMIDVDGTSGPCDPIDFSIRGHRRAPLIGGYFLRRVQRLLGVRLNPSPGTAAEGRSVARR